MIDWGARAAADDAQQLAANSHQTFGVAVRFESQARRCSECPCEISTVANRQSSRKTSIGESPIDAEHSPVIVRKFCNNERQRGLVIYQSTTAPTADILRGNRRQVGVARAVINDEPMSSGDRDRLG